MEYDFTIANVDTKGRPRGGSSVELQRDHQLCAGCKPNARIDGNSLCRQQKRSAEYADGQITYTANSKASELFEGTYKVVLTWADDGSNNAGQTTAGNSKVSLSTGLTLTVVATQAV